MKTATLPSIRVKPELRVEIESLLNDNESLSGFVEASVRESVQRRRNQVEFMATEVRHLFAKIPVSATRPANKFNNLREFLAQK